MAGVSDEWQGGTLHIKEVFTYALFLATLNVGTSNLKHKSMAEVDTAGRYIKLSRQCAEGISCPHAHFTGASIYTNGAGVDSVCFVSKVSYGLKLRTSRGEIPRFLFVWLINILDKHVRLSGINGHKKKENK